MSDASRADGEARAAAVCSALIPALSAAAVLVVGAAAWIYTVDDAYVLGRYARRLASGQGYTFVSGGPTDGVTGPLGLLPGVLGELLGADAVVASKAFGLLCAATAAGGMTWRAQRERTARGIATGSLLASWPLLGIWGVAGLETGMATLACAALASGLVDSRPWRLGAAVLALAWLRPEAALSALLALILLTRVRGRGSLPAWWLAGAGALSVVLFRWLMFDAPLPLSASAKPPDLAHGLGYVGRSLLVVFGGLGVLPLFWGAWRGAPADTVGVRGRRAVFWLVIAHLFAVVLAGGDWMPGFRLVVPWLPAIAWVMAAPIARPFESRPGRCPADRAPGRSAGSRAAAVGLFLAATLLPLGSGLLALADAREAGVARESAGRDLADWLSANARRVALVDIGYIGYRTDVFIIDLGGITDPAVGRLPGGHVSKRVDPGWLRARAPDTIVLHSSTAPRVGRAGRLVRFTGHPVERRVAQMGWVRAELRVARVLRYSASAHYIVLQRDRGIRPETGVIDR